MNDIKIFNNQEFGEIRTIIIGNETYFVGKDVAEALGYTDTFGALKKHVDGEDKQNCQNDSFESPRGMTVINESGLYSLILSSKLESAKKFKRWVTSEVLPQLRKTGSYQMENMSTELKAVIVLDRKILQVEEKISDVEKDLQTFKAEIPILGIEENKITKAVRIKGVDCLGGKKANAYKSKSLRQKVYTDIHMQLRREFGVTTYKAIKRNECEKAIEIIKGYKVPHVLKEQIKDVNNQMNIKIV